MKPRLYFTYNSLRSSETHHYHTAHDDGVVTHTLAHEPPIRGSLELPADGDFVIEVMLFERYFYTPEDAAQEMVGEGWLGQARDPQEIELGLVDFQTWCMIGADEETYYDGGDMEKGALGGLKLNASMGAGAVGIIGWTA